MWLSYLKVAFRSLIKQRLYAFINIAGLAIGVTTCILILMYVRYEKSYDTANPQASQIQRLGLAGKLGDNAFRMTNSTAPAGQAMLEEYPEVINYVRIGILVSPFCGMRIRCFQKNNGGKLILLFLKFLISR